MVRMHGVGEALGLISDSLQERMDLLAYGKDGLVPTGRVIDRASQCTVSRVECGGDGPLLVSVEGVVSGHARARGEQGHGDL